MERKKSIDKNYYNYSGGNKGIVWDWAEAFCQQFSGRRNKLGV